MLSIGYSLFILTNKKSQVDLTFNPPRRIICHSNWLTFFRLANRHSPFTFRLPGGKIIPLRYHLQNRWSPSFPRQSPALSGFPWNMSTWYQDSWHLLPHCSSQPDGLPWQMLHELPGCRVRHPCRKSVFYLAFFLPSCLVVMTLLIG